MPKLHEDFHKPRVAAYQAAIQAITKTCENEHPTSPLNIECQWLKGKLELERQRFVAKFNVEMDCKCGKVISSQSLVVITDACGNMACSEDCRDHADFGTGAPDYMSRPIEDFTTDQLKQMWDEWDNYIDQEDGSPLRFHYETLHLELNLRGEGAYCAV